MKIFFVASALATSSSLWLLSSSSSPLFFASAAAPSAPPALAAFVSVGHRRSRHHHSSRDCASSSLFASADNNILTIETLTDLNSDALLNPSVGPSGRTRPVLVDAFAPWCGPCKLLDKVLKKSHPKYAQDLDFVRWNINDKENTGEFRASVFDSGYAFNKLPSLLLFRDGKPIAMRPGMANEYQLDKFLEQALPDLLVSTFDENGGKLSEFEIQNRQNEMDVNTDMQRMEGNVSVVMDAIDEQLHQAEEQEQQTECETEISCYDMVAEQEWGNRVVVPAMEGIKLPQKQ